MLTAVVVAAGTAAAPIGCLSFLILRFFTSGSGAAGLGGSAELAAAASDTAADGAAADAADAAEAAAAAAAAVVAAELPLASIGGAAESTASILRLCGFDGLGLIIGVAGVEEAAAAAFAAWLGSSPADDGLGVVLVLVTLDDNVSRSAAAGGKQVRGLGEKDGAAAAGEGAAAAAGITTDEAAAAAVGRLGAEIDCGGNRDSRRLDATLAAGRSAGIIGVSAAAAGADFVPAAAAAAAAAARAICFSLAYRFCVACAVSHCFTLSMCFTLSAGSLSASNEHESEQQDAHSSLTRQTRANVADQVMPVGSLGENGVTPSR